MLSTIFSFFLSAAPIQVWDGDTLCREATEPNYSWRYDQPPAGQRVLSREAPWKVTGTYRPGWGWKAIGDPEFIDGNGGCEWAWQDGTLYVNAEQPIIVKQGDWCARVEAGQTLDGGKFHHCRGILAFDGAVIKNVTVHHAEYGVLTWSGGTVTVKKSKFTNIQRGAVVAWGSDLIATGNKIDTVGVDGGWVQLWGAITSTGADSLISGNQIKHAGYSGISVRGGLVEGNDISYVCLRLADCGGIYAAAGVTDIINNAIRHAHGVASGLRKDPTPYIQAAGIYYDEGAHDGAAEGNIVEDVDTRVHLHKSINITIDGTVYDCPGSCDL